ncbi:DNA polymerase III epsilon subunit-like protein [Saccharothrix ecbatanensis]|uniref:DNA polymerase III epsilon subunit-like protein n=1 Tax=Saccharothrix ecbatanensis TaxID=1105145 RepID=A0A7W9HGE3_9PSEU|nr:3'-5' exonuclease [Saccharothrix ecbatanensis]MBB5801511.1 DNA polymerase III epsilon subunit-like protein [Saccharothrix ecbatanensis]
MIGQITAALAGRRLSVVDVADNGSRPPEIVGIGVLNVNDSVVDLPLRTWLVRPVVPVSSVAANVHGIGNGDLGRCPLWHGVAREVEPALTGRVLVAHDAPAVHRVLAAHLPAWRPPLVLDTTALAQHVWPELIHYELSDLVAHAELATVDVDGRRLNRVGQHAWDTWSLLLVLVAAGSLTWDDLVEAATTKDFRPAAIGR